MREGETKKGVEKARERTVCGRGGANGVLQCFSLQPTHLLSPFNGARLPHLGYSLDDTVVVTVVLDLVLL